MRIGSMTAATAVAITINLALASRAEAYIDPGTGTMMLQVAGAVIAAALFYLRSIRLWIAGRLGLGGGARPEAAPPAPDEAPADKPKGD
jgi:hypothetical protein